MSEFKSEPEFSSKALIEQYLQGNDIAANQLFARYVRQLTRICRQRLRGKIEQRLDAEDIIQSVYRSFFVRVENKQLWINRSGDLWKLLVGMTLNKTRRVIDFHISLKRNIAREASTTSTSDDLLHQHATQLASVEDSVALEEILQQLMLQLSPLEKTIVELRLQGESNQQIAERIQRSTRTVHRF